MILSLLLLLTSNPCVASTADFPPPKVSVLCPEGFRPGCSEYCCTIYSSGMVAAANKQCRSEKAAWAAFDMRAKIGERIYAICTGKPENCLADLNSWLDVSTDKLAKDLEQADAEFGNDSAAALANYIRCMSGCCN